MSNPIDLPPDIEAIVGYAIRQTGVRCYSSIPNRPEYPLAVVARYGGEAPNRRRLNKALLQVDVYGTTQAEARQLAADIRSVVHETEGTAYYEADGAPDDCFLSGVEDTGQGLRRVPDLRDNLTRYTMDFHVYFHAIEPLPVGPWTPASITGIWGWWDATALIGYTEGQVVASLTDLSGNGHDATKIGSLKRAGNPGGSSP